MSTENMQAFRMSSLVLINAMLLQEVLSQNLHDVRPLRRLLNDAAMQSQSLTDEFLTQWHEIEFNHDFVPIFRLARRVLLTMPADAKVEVALEKMANTAISISTKRAALRHDLMGRVFHRLLADAKYYGAFYTKIPSATMLLKLAVDENDMGLNWASDRAIKKLRIVDFACGTGTLLKAALRVSVEKYIMESLKGGRKPRLNAVYKRIVEDGLFGFDVISSAVHIAATAIAMHNPDIEVDRMNLYVMPLGPSIGPPGRTEYKLGSIEFARRDKLLVEESLEGDAIGAGSVLLSEKTEVELPRIHICAMNPPFTRSVYGNLLFGGVKAQKGRKELQKELQKLRSSADLSASITAGLGSIFVAVADRFLDKDSVMALVLPKTVLVGSSWLPTRNLFSKYHLQYVVTSHEPNNWAFSESTNLSEVLLILRKMGKEKRGPTRFVNLWSQPRTSIEAIGMVQSIRAGRGASLTAMSGSSELMLGGRKFGEMVSVQLDPSGQIPWGLPASFTQTDLCRAAYHLTLNELFIPGKGIMGRIPTVSLAEVVNLGPDGRDVYDGFALTKSKTLYLAFWGHDADKTTGIAQEPNAFLNPLSDPLPGRRLKDANNLWSKAGPLLLPKELWLPTTRVSSVLLSSRALSNVWWPARWLSGKRKIAEKMEKGLSLWFNSTLGLFSLLMRRQETRGAWVKFPKTWYKTLPVVDLRTFSTNTLNDLSDLWNDVATKELLPLPRMADDKTRVQIDQGLSQILNLADVSQLREMLGREPVITMKPL